MIYVEKKDRSAFAITINWVFTSISLCILFSRHLTVYFSLSQNCHDTTPALILSILKAIAICVVQRDVLKLKLALPQ
jgi:hypothetical protein